jgi:signal transduction histidine kinase
MRSWGVRPALFLRLEADQTRIGVLIVGRIDGRFTQAEINALEPLLPQITTALHTSATLLEVKRRQQLEAIVGDVAVAIASARSLRDFLPQGLGELCNATQAALAALLLRDAAPIVSPFLAVDDVASQTLLSKIRIEDTVREELQAWRGPEVPRLSGLYIPVRFGSQLVGTLALFRTDGEVFQADDRTILIRLANVTALAWAAERYQQQRSELARRDERARIADELHDDLAQMLFAAQMNLDSILLGETPVDPAVREGILRGRDLLGRVDEAVRHVIHQLARPTPHDLCSRLRQIADAVEGEFGLPVRLELADDAAAAASELRGAERDVLAKVARELLINAAKHAGPCRATVKLRLGMRDRLLLTVIDDGVGLDADRAAAGHGLRAIRGALRAQCGTLRVSAGLGGGLHATAAIGLTGRAGRKATALAAPD